MRDRPVISFASSSHAVVVYTQARLTPGPLYLIYEIYIIQISLENFTYFDNIYKHSHL